MLDKRPTRHAVVTEDDCLLTLFPEIANSIRDRADLGMIADCAVVEGCAQAIEVVLQASILWHGGVMRLVAGVIALRARQEKRFVARRQALRERSAVVDRAIALLSCYLSDD